jgi:hypothetical protein
LSHVKEVKQTNNNKKKIKLRDKNIGKLDVVGIPVVLAALEAGQKYCLSPRG